MLSLLPFAPVLLLALLLRLLAILKLFAMQLREVSIVKLSLLLAAPIGSVADGKVFDETAC